MRLLAAAVVFMGLGLATARADVPRDPNDRGPRVERPAPRPQPQPSKTPDAAKACGVGAGIVVLAIGVFGAWRLSVTRRQEEATA